MNGWVERSSIQGSRGAVQWMPNNFYVGAKQTGWKRGLTLYSKNKLHKFEKLSAVHVKERRKG